jgi:predicted ATP-dependent Lon-type protease
MDLVQQKNQQLHHLLKQRFVRSFETVQRIKTFTNNQIVLQEKIVLLNGIMDTKAAQIRKLEVSTILIPKKVCAKKDLTLDVEEMPTFSSVKKNVLISACVKARIGNNF